MSADSFSALNRREGKVVATGVALDSEGGFVEVGSGRSLEKEIGIYSRMKFGDVEAIQWWATILARATVGELKSGGSLREMFERCKEKGEYIYLMAPGVRNVISASNRLMRETAHRVNAYLSLQGLPTMICRPLTRLGSGRANYAQLDAKSRQSRHKTTKSIIPRSEFEEQAIHVVFLDDVEITGSTVNRAQKRCLEGGALSFHSLFAMRATPALALQDSGIEHRMNQFAVRGNLDETVAAILDHEAYQPVQRMLRLLLHPSNRLDLNDFADRLKSNILLRLYLQSLSNDYLHIQSPDQEDLPLYSDSVQIIRMVLLKRKLINQQGLPI